MVKTNVCDQGDKQYLQTLLIYVNFEDFYCRPAAGKNPPANVNIIYVQTRINIHCMCNS